MRFVAALVGVVIVLACGVLQAQEEDQALTFEQLVEHLNRAHESIQEMIEEGEIEADPVLGVITASSVEVRDAPPGGPLNLLIGPRIDVEIEQGTVVEILDVKYVGTFDGRQAWYSIRPLYPRAEARGTSWWINAGLEDDGQVPKMAVTTFAW